MSGWFSRATAILVCVYGLALIGWLAPSLEGAPVRPWIAPPRVKLLKNPVPATPKAMADAVVLFRLNCAGCHGENGDGNGPASVVLPRKAANFTDGKTMSAMTDGELFWKMSNGRAPMPAWKELLPVKQRWELVNYLRTFAHTSGGAQKSASK
jgi:mono/diheme cytochrome c family protein